MFGGWLRERSEGPSLDGFYFERADLIESFDEALSKRRHLLVHGLPRQGKTTFVRKALGDRPFIIIHGSSEITFADIFRVYLLTLGCSVTVEQTRRKKLGTKADVKLKFKIPFLTSGGVGVSGEAETEHEETDRNFTADISNANDVCYLLKELGATPYLILDRFEELSSNQRKTMLDALPLFYESGALEVVLIAASSDIPLDYHEQIRLSRCLSQSTYPRCRGRRPIVS